jgi:hypothetical protein
LDTNLEAPAHHTQALCPLYFHIEVSNHLLPLFHGGFRIHRSSPLVATFLQEVGNVFRTQLNVQLRVTGPWESGSRGFESSVADVPSNTVM